MTEVSKLTELRKLMLSMERTLGLQDLSAVERDVYCAADELAQKHGKVQTTGLLGHSLVADVSRPTFYRALKSLVKKGYLCSSDKVPRGQYIVKNPKT
jgi:hypothetical protein